MSQKSISEHLFETFCNLNQIHWKRIEETPSAQRPDYRVRISSQDFIVEIKQFDASEEEKAIIMKQQRGENIAFSINPGERVRKAIRNANSQLKQFSEGIIPTLLVVYDNVTPDPDPWLCHTADYCVMTAMKGVDQIQIKVPQNPKKSIIFGELESGGKRTMRSDANTTVSAAAAIYAGDVISLRVFHNRFAALPIDPTLLHFGNVKQFRLPEDSKNSLEEGWIPL